MNDIEEGRQKRGKHQSGKIIKGTLSDAAMKLKVSSIPTKMQNVIYNNHHKSAFGNSQERFYIRNQDKIYASPGPGNYNPDKISTKINSKKGSGIFASQTKLDRLQTKINWNPAPGKYDVKPLTHRHKSKSTALLSSQLQAHDIFKHEISIAKQMPGPGQYGKQKLVASLSSTSTAFKSQINRFPIPGSVVPGVGHYKWQQIKRKVKAIKFDIRNDKDHSLSLHNKYLDKLVGKHNGIDQIGPGKYDPKPFDGAKTFEIKQNNLDRFGRNIKSYTMSNFNEPIKLSQNQSIKPLAPSSNFKSKTRRYQFGQQQTQYIGDPCHYSPTKPQKKSHLINFSNHWV